jgi:hypothetical protein
MHASWNEQDRRTREQPKPTTEEAKPTTEDQTDRPSNNDPAAQAGRPTTARPQTNKGAAIFLIYHDSSHL